MHDGYECHDCGYRGDEPEQKWAIVKEDWVQRFNEVREIYKDYVTVSDERLRLNLAASHLGTTIFTVTVVGPNELLFIPSETYEVYETNAEVPADRLVFRPEAISDLQSKALTRLLANTGFEDSPAMKKFLESWAAQLIELDYTVRSGYATTKTTSYKIKPEVNKS